MTRPYVLPHDVWLYHPVEGKRLFPQGETDPGDLWMDSPGGKPTGGKTVEAAMLELADANERLDALGRQVDRGHEAIHNLTLERDRAVAECEAMRLKLVEAETALGAQVETRQVPGAAEGISEIIIPRDWETLPFLSVRALARKIAGHNNVSAKAEVFDVIRRHLGLVPA